MKLPRTGTAQRRVDGNVAARHNDERVLFFIGKFGHLRVIELAALAWPQSPHASALELARRTLRRLARNKLVLERRTALGGYAHVLTGVGAERVRAAFGLPCRDGYDIQGVTGPTFRHRTFATAYLAERRRAGAEVWGEYALAKGWGPVTTAYLSRHFRKWPDGLIRLSSDDLKARGLRAEAVAYDWLEVESTYKQDGDIANSLAVCRHLEEPLGNGILSGLVFAFDRSERHEQHILRVARGRLPEKLLLGYESVAHAVRLARCRIAVPFVLCSVEESTMAAAGRARPAPAASD